MAKRYPSRLKFQIVMEVLTGQKRVGQVAKEYGVHPNSINTWKRQLEERGPEIFEQSNKASEDKQHIAKLERLLGQKEVEIALLKNFLGRNE
jgi:transposase-like protein